MIIIQYIKLYTIILDWLRFTVQLVRVIHPGHHEEVPVYVPDRPHLWPTSRHWLTWYQASLAKCNVWNAIVHIQIIIHTSTYFRGRWGCRRSFLQWAVSGRVSHHLRLDRLPGPIQDDRCPTNRIRLYRQFGRPVWSTDQCDPAICNWHMPHRNGWVTACKRRTALPICL